LTTSEVEVAFTPGPSEPEPPRRRHRLSGLSDRARAFGERMPLRVRLLASVLALMVASLFLIGAASVMFMDRYLTSRVNDQLASLTVQILKKAQSSPDGHVDVSQLLPSSTNPVVIQSAYEFELRDANGEVLVGANGNQQRLKWPDTNLPYPSLPTDPASLNAHASTGDPDADKAFTTGSESGNTRWRVLVYKIDSTNGAEYLIVSADLSNVSSAVAQLIRIETLVGMAVLLVIAVVATAVVSSSLRPLRDIERTAGAIARGQLDQRVPERDPRTELGRLGRALNVMLGQIESAFEAQRGSEVAALGSADAARRAANAARESAAAAHRSEERMRRFVADASHELRTPLTTIRGFAELYRQRADSSPAEAERLMRRIEAESARMSLLVEDLLLLARMDQQRPVAHDPVDLLAVAADTVQASRAIAPGRDISLRVGGGSDDAGPPVVLGDEPRLRQVVRNLVDNALAHTPADTPVQVRVRTELSDGNGGAPAAIVEVADSGPGLTPEQAERVFERFYRADKARTRAAGGTGLGLAIVASLVAAHHGTVTVDSAPGQGATFRVRLPLAPDDPDEDQDDQAEQVDGAAESGEVDQLGEGVDAGNGSRTSTGSPAPSGSTGSRR
jgi:two-component system OmpR family sensor kinase